MYKVFEKGNFKLLSSPDYNFIFSKQNGFFARWGKTKQDNPPFSSFGPELLDIEISTICHGPFEKPCKWCYKSNTEQGKNMSLDTFQKILAKVPSGPLTQIAFGVGDIDANSDLWEIFAATRQVGVVPNITINGARLKDHHIVNLASFCGAVAVSNYGKDLCYNAVEQLTQSRSILNATLQQVNIHQILSEQTFAQCIELLEDIQNDSRLKDLNAVVFLMLKPKGNRNTLTRFKNAQAYKDFVNSALDQKLRIGFDSCTAPSFLRAIKDREEYAKLEEFAEPCESTCFSLYVDVEGKAYPCSFCEGESDWQTGIDLLQVDNFLEEVWNESRICSFRNNLHQSEKETGCRQCPVFDIEIG